MFHLNLLTPKLSPTDEYNHLALGRVKSMKSHSQVSIIITLQGCCLTVAWGALFESAGNQISEQVARTGALLDSSSLSCMIPAGIINSGLLEK